MFVEGFEASYLCTVEMPALPSIIEASKDSNVTLLKETHEKIMASHSVFFLFLVNYTYGKEVYKRPNT